MICTGQCVCARVCWEGLRKHLHFLQVRSDMFHLAEWTEEEVEEMKRRRRRRRRRRACW